MRTLLVLLMLGARSLAFAQPPTPSPVHPPQWVAFTHQFQVPLTRKEAVLLLSKLEGQVLATFQQRAVFLRVVHHHDGWVFYQGEKHEWAERDWSGVAVLATVVPAASGSVVQLLVHAHGWEDAQVIIDGFGDVLPGR